MKRAVVALWLAAAGCTPTVVLGTLAADGGSGDLGDMQACIDCDQAPPLYVDLASHALDMGDGLLIPDL